MNASELKQLKVTAAKVRLGIIEGVFAAKSGHPGGSLSAAEILPTCILRNCASIRKILRMRIETALSSLRGIARPAFIAC